MNSTLHSKQIFISAGMHNFAIRRITFKCVTQNSRNSSGYFMGGPRPGPREGRAQFLEPRWWSVEEVARTTRPLLWRERVFSDKEVFQCSILPIYFYYMFPPINAYGRPTETNELHESKAGLSQKFLWMIVFVVCLLSYIENFTSLMYHRHISSSQLHFSNFVLNYLTWWCCSVFVSSLSRDAVRGERLKFYVVRFHFYSRIKYIWRDSNASFIEGVRNIRNIN